MSTEVLSGQELEDFLAFQKTQEQTTDEGILINDLEASGRIDAFLAGMTNNEDYKTRWLAEKRFPDLVEQGVDPMSMVMAIYHTKIRKMDLKLKKSLKKAC
jgi:hypothetical protein